MSGEAGYIGGYESGYYPIDDLTPTIPEVDDTVEGRPDTILRFAFDDFGSPELTWYDESDRLRRFNLNRGRASELDEIQPGRAQVVIDDRDGEFASDNPDSSYAGLLVPRRWMQLLAVLGDGAEPLMAKYSHAGETDALRAAEVVEPLITTLVDSFPHEWHISDNDATATLDGVDASSVLAEAPIPEVADPITGQLSPKPFSGNIGSCIAQLLALAGWPTATETTEAPVQTSWLDIEEGASNVVQPLVTSANVLATIQLLARTDGGTFFIARDGRATYRAPNVPRANVGVWGDIAGEDPYSAIADDPEVAHLVNEVTIRDVTTQQVFKRVDGESRQKFGVAAKEFSMASTAGLGARADEILAERAQPRKRIAGLQPQGKDSLTLWRGSVPRELHDQGIVRRRPGYGGLLERSMSLEGIRIDSPSKRKWTVVWDLGEDVQGPPNLLTPNQSGLEGGDTTGWLAGTNTLISVSIVRALFGDGSLLIEAEPGKFGEDEYSGALSCITTPPQDVLVTVGETYTAGAYFFGSGAGAHGMAMGVDIVWYSIGLAVLGTDSSPSVAGQWNRWTGVNVQGVAPSNAAYAALRLRTEGVQETPGIFRDVWADAMFLKLAS